MSLAVRDWRSSLDTGNEDDSSVGMDIFATLFASFMVLTGLGAILVGELPLKPQDQYLVVTYSNTKANTNLPSFVFSLYDPNNNTYKYPDKQSTNQGNEQLVRFDGIKESDKEYKLSIGLADTEIDPAFLEDGAEIKFHWTHPLREDRDDLGANPFILDNFKLSGKGGSEPPWVLPFKVKYARKD